MTDEKLKQTVEVLEDVIAAVKARWFALQHSSTCIALYGGGGQPCNCGAVRLEAEIEDAEAWIATLK